MSEPTVEPVTVKDQYAQVIEQGLRDLGHAGDANDTAILLVQQLEAYGLMPFTTEYRVSNPDEDYPYEVFTTLESIPALKEGDYLLRRYSASWVKA